MAPEVDLEQLAKDLPGLSGGLEFVVAGVVRCVAGR